MQEANKVSKQDVNDQNKSEITVESFRQSSKRKAILKSISRGSSELANSSRRSLSLAFGLPSGLNITDAATEEPDSPSVAQQQAPEVSLRRLAYLNKPEIPVVLIGTVVSSISGVLLPVYSILASSVIKTFYEKPHELRKDSKFWALMFLVLGLVSLLTNPIQSYFFALAGSKLIERIRSMCFEKVVHMEVGWFDEPENSSGIIGAKLSSDAAKVHALVGDALAQMVQDIVTMITALVISFFASWELALIILSLVPLLGVNDYVQQRFMKGFSANSVVCSKTNNLVFVTAA